jgi:hypothetical protein
MTKIFCIKLNEYQQALIFNFWELRIISGLIRLHFYWTKKIKGKEYDYYEDDISAELICKKHKLKVQKNE